MRTTPTLATCFGLALAAVAAGGLAAHAQKNAAPPAMKQPIPPEAPDSGGPAPAPRPTAPGAFTMGEIGRRATYGQDGGWLTSASPDGALVFTNTGSASGWNATIVQSPRAPYTVQVQVNSGITPAPGRAVGAGLTFAFQRSDDPKQRSFYAVLIAGDTISAYRYGGGSFAEVARNTTSDLAGARRWNTLRITVRPEGFTLALNGQQFLSTTTDGPLTGDMGVMVSGAGDAAFRNLDLH